MSTLSYARGPDAPILDKTINVRMLWCEFDRESDQTARGLAGLGLEPVDRVGLWSGNCIEWVLVQMACARAGFVLVNVNPACRSHVPAMYVAELEHPEFARFDLRSLRAAWMGGAPCPAEVLRRVKDDEAFEECAGNVGCAMPNTGVKIASLLTGETVPRGEAGELCTRGYLVIGYDDKPESTGRAIDAGGWLHTGDVAVLDEGGHFQITGRAREMIIRGGENIYPSEVEQFLFTHPKIAEAEASVRLRARESATQKFRVRQLELEAPGEAAAGRRLFENGARGGKSK